jgi:predicted dehydrogenase
MGKSVKIGCVGLGRGKEIMSSTLYDKSIQIRAICDKNIERLEEYRDYLESEGVKDLLTFEGYEDMLKSDIDAVVIATDIDLHPAMCVQAMEAGKHVLSEIPIIRSVEDAKLLMEASKAYPGIKYMTGENCCFWAFIETWKHMHDKGMLGDVWYAEGEYLHNTIHLRLDENGNPTWRAKTASHAITYITHDLGPLLYIMNDRCVNVTAFAPEINPYKGIREYPNEVAIFKTAKGALIKIFTGFGVIRPANHNYVMYGSRGTLETNRAKRGVETPTYAYLEDIPYTKNMFEIPTEKAFSSEGRPGDNAANKGYAGHGGADRRMMHEFAASIINDTKPPVDLRQGIEMSLPGIYAKMSVEQGSKTLEIPNLFE